MMTPYDFWKLADGEESEQVDTDDYLMDEAECDNDTEPFELDWENDF